MKHLDAVRELADNPHEIELALWFHDAIYKPFSSTNEKDSAVCAQEFFQSNDFEGSEIIDRIYDLIMVTEHTGEVKTNDQKLMIDIDLSILGTPTNIYTQFEKDVRFEYKRVPMLLFKKKRREIYKSFLNAIPFITMHIFTISLSRRRGLIWSWRSNAWPNKKPKISP